MPLALCAFDFERIKMSPHQVRIKQMRACVLQSGGLALGMMAVHAVCRFHMAARERKCLYIDCRRAPAKREVARDACGGEPKRTAACHNHLDHQSASMRCRNATHAPPPNRQPTVPRCYNAISDHDGTRHEYSSRRAMQLAMRTDAGMQLAMRTC